MKSSRGRACAIGSLLALQSPGSTSSSSTPNFVILFADDIGFGDTSLTCGLPESEQGLCPKTPNIEYLAQSNSTVWFDRFYAAPNCSPSRAMLLTGRNNVRACIDGVLDCSLSIWECSGKGKGMARNHFSIADAVKATDSEYMTQMVGKW